MAQVVFKVTSTANAYWLAVDNDDLPVVNGKATADLEPGQHTVVWWMLGNPGSGIKLTVEQDGEEIDSVESKVPEGYTHGAGYLYFVVK